MGMMDSLRNSLEDSVINVVLRKGFPVVAEGMENKNLAAHGYGHLAWKDTESQQHVKGGYRQAPYSSRSVEVPGCDWILRNIAITKDEADEATGKHTIEVSGMTCTCGIISNKTIRYTAIAEKVVEDIARELNKSVLTAA
jgi:hypothetical protein